MRGTEGNFAGSGFAGGPLIASHPLGTSPRGGEEVSQDLRLSVEMRPLG